MLRPTYPIRTERLDLRPFTEDDFDDVLAFRSREDVARYLLTDRLGPEGVRDLLRRSGRMTALRREGDELHLAAVRRDTGRVVGDLVLVWRSAEAARALLALGFDDLGLHRAIGRCDARNRASARVLERLGMRREAHFVQNELVKGAWTDELVYAMLADEWRASLGS
jgi:RimJ/RimL family protein N-acetyltransferase